MKLGRREFVVSTMALVATGCSGGGTTASATPAPTPVPSPSPSPSPTPTPTPTPSGLYPSYNVSPLAADSSGMTGTATDLAAHIKLGWNAGNTLEAIGVGGETAWGNPLLTQTLMDKVKALGFDAVRLPCSWDQYADKTTAKISDTWLKRVKDVVQYCMNANLYVLLNIHWDGGWLENHVDAADKDAVVAKQKAFWEQIATTMRDFDQRLMFASANEPAADKAGQADILLTYHQTFIDAVRSTGGKNAYRTLVVQAPNTNIDLAVSGWKMPTDTASNRLMLEVHYYSPPNFAILTSDASWGKMFYYWGKDYHSTIEPDRNATWGEEDYVDQEMLSMKTSYTSKGIPVIIGEFGAPRRTDPKDLAMHNASLKHWYKYVAKQGLANGLMPFVWDTGGIIARDTLAVKDQDVLDGLLEGVGKK